MIVQLTACLPGTNNYRESHGQLTKLLAETYVTHKFTQPVAERFLQSLSADSISQNIAR